MNTNKPISIIIYPHSHLMRSCIREWGLSTIYLGNEKINRWGYFDCVMITLGRALLRVAFDGSCNHGFFSGLFRTDNKNHANNQ